MRGLRCVVCHKKLPLDGPEPRLYWAGFGRMHKARCAEALLRHHKDYSRSARGKFRPAWLALKLARAELAG